MDRSENGNIPASDEFGGNARVVPIAAPLTRSVPRPRSVPNGDERMQTPQGRWSGDLNNQVVPSSLSSVPGYPSPVAFPYGAASSTPGGTYGQAVFPPPLPPPMYSGHTYAQGPSLYSHMPYPPAPSGYPPLPQGYSQQYHHGHTAQPHAQLFYPGYVQPGGPYPQIHNPGIGHGPPHHFNVESVPDSSKYLPVFNEATLRTGFIRKVLCLVLVQLVVTTAVAATALTVNPIKNYLDEHRWVFWSSWIGAMALLIIGLCNYSLLRHHPRNMIYLGILNILISLMVGAIVARYESEAVLLAFVITVALVFTLVLLTLRSNFDITNWGGMLFAFLLVLVLTSIIGIFWVNSIFNIVIAALGAVLFSVYLVYDVQMLMGDKKRALSPDDYVLGAISVYLDVINIFLYLLSIIGLARSCGRVD